jgi:diadenosine tetraphosphate (Ap4A) HIT family hydrolase
MTVTHTIRVPLPEHATLTPEAEGELRRMFEVIAEMRCEPGNDWRDVLLRLRAAGWSVECGLQWHVVARRGGEIEEACGFTRDEAFEKLDRVTRTETLVGTP